MLPLSQPLRRMVAHQEVVPPLPVPPRPNGVTFGLRSNSRRCEVRLHNGRAENHQTFSKIDIHEHFNYTPVAGKLDMRPAMGQGRGVDHCRLVPAEYNIPDEDDDEISDIDSVSSEVEEEVEAEGELEGEEIPKPQKSLLLVRMKNLRFNILAETSERMKLIQFGPLQFVDSMAFLKASLDGLMAAQLKANDCDPRKAFPLVYALHPKSKLQLEPGSIPAREGIDLMTQKLAFAYEALTGLESYDLPALLPQEAYRSSLANHDCSNEEYAKIGEVVARLQQVTFKDVLYDYQALRWPRALGRHHLLCRSIPRHARH